MTDPQAFAAEWVAAWNSHDLERVLSHYAEDVELYAPASTRFTGDPTGRVRGKTALRDYWAYALTAVPDLAFTLRAVYAGAGGLAIRFHSSRTGGESVEVFRFDEAGLVRESSVYYE